MAAGDQGQGRHPNLFKHVIDIVPTVLEAETPLPPGEKAGEVRFEE